MPAVSNVSADFAWTPELRFRRPGARCPGASRPGVPARRWVDQAAKGVAGSGVSRLFCDGSPPKRSIRARHRRAWRPDQFRRVIVGVTVHNVDDRERLVGAARRHAELIDDRPVLVLANDRDVGVAIGRSWSRSSNTIEAHRGSSAGSQYRQQRRLPPSCDFTLTCTRLLAGACARPPDRRQSDPEIRLHCDCATHQHGGHDG